MTKDTLRALLDHEGVRRDAYCLDGETPEYEALCLDGSGDAWTVYYFERGLHTGERAFTSEDEACQYLADRLLSDPSTRAS
jgi:hypothetical protein